jgi:hypothetical protein
MQLVKAWTLLICCGGLLIAGPALASVDDSHFGRSPDGARLEFDLRDVPRREVLDRLFADQTIKLEWLNRTVADELISGSFRGTLVGLTRQLLAQLDFVLISEAVDGNVVIKRVVIVGQGGKQGSPGLATLEGALRMPEKPGDSPQAKSRGKLSPAVDSSPFGQKLLTDASSSVLPRPLPTASGSSLPVPTPMPTPSSLGPPIPREAALPSVAPIAGGNSAVLPPPGQSPVVK